MKLVFVTKKLSRLWLLLEALFGFQEKKLASYHDFGSLPGVFENQFQMTFQIDNFFFNFRVLKIMQISKKVRKDQRA